MPVARERENLTNVVREYTVQASPYNTSSDTLLGFAFQINQLPNYTDFDIYDRYRIMKVELTFMPSWGPAEPALAGNAVVGPFVSTTGTFCPDLLLAEDWDNATAAPRTSLQCYANHKHVLLDRPRTFTVYPRPLQVTTSGLYADAGGSDGKPVWLSTDFFGVQHFGTKAVIGPNVYGSPGTPGPYLTIFAKFYVQFSGMI
jgi:hypothetical protein